MIAAAAAPRQPHFSARKDHKTLSADGCTVMSAFYLRQLSLQQKGYATPALNDVLYLHFKNFGAIDNLVPYHGLKSLWLEGNALTAISGLSTLHSLRCLFLNQNAISTIQDIQHLHLHTLNISNNLIKTTLGLPKTLCTLQIAHNFICTLADLEPLSICQDLTVLDISNNKITDPATLAALLPCTQLRVLSTLGNECARFTSNYRKTVVFMMKELVYFEDSPVSDHERLRITAWGANGLDGERAERERQNAERVSGDQRAFDGMSCLI